MILHNDITWQVYCKFQILMAVSGLLWSWSYGRCVYNYLCNQYLSPLKSRSNNTTLCDKVCQWLVADQWFSLATLVTSTSKTDDPGCQVILYSYIFRILLYFLYLSKISYNYIPKSYIFSKLWERKSWIFNFEWNFK
jgi:hypothetical protein